MKNFIIFLSFIIITINCSKQTKDNILTVGMELAYPPFETKDENGNPSGVSVEIAKALAVYLGKELRIENIAWNGLIPSLKTKKIDFIISSMTITDERKKEIDFSVPYANVPLAILANKNSQIDSYSDLNRPGKIVAVKQGTTGFFFAEHYFPNASINTFSSESAALTEVLQNKADAFIYDQLTTYKANLNNPDTTKIIFIHNDLQNSEWGIGVRKGNSELLSNINTFLETFKDSTTYSNIIDKYLKEEKNLADTYQVNFIM